MNLLEKIQKIRDWFVGNRGEVEDVVKIDHWTDHAKRLILLDSLYSHDGMKYVSEIFESEVKNINKTLREKYSKDLPDLERDRLMDRRDLAREYLELFSGNARDLEELEEAVDNELAQVE